MRLLALHSTVMLLLLTGLCLSVTAQRNTITLLPVRFQPVGDTVTVRVWTTLGTSGQSLQVSALNESNNTPVTRNLQFNPSTRHYEVRFPLTNFPNDTVLLRINGSNGSWDHDEVPVIHQAGYMITPDALPQIIMNTPANQVVGDPEVPLKGKVTDNTDSSRLIYSIYRANDGFSSVSFSWDSVDTQLDLSAFNGQRIYLLIQALDSNQQSTALDPIILYSETSPYLTPYYVTDGLIIDFNYNKLLVIDEGPVSNPRIVSVPGGTTVSIPFTGTVNTGYLTPQGALLGVNAPSTNRDSLYDFNSGNLLAIGPLTRGTLQTAGDYCVWTFGTPNGFFWTCMVYSDSLYLRNLATTSDQFIGFAARQFSSQTSFNSVTTNGTVWFIDSMGRMVSQLGNTRTIVKDQPIGCGLDGPFSPVADSFSVAYGEVSDYPTGISWSKGNINVPFNNVSRRPWLDYRVNGKYIGYINIPLASPGTAEIKLADTLGNNTMIDDGSRTISYLEGLNRTGDLMYILDGDSRWLAPLATTPVNISSQLGKSYYSDGSWYVSIGNTLYSVGLNIQPDMLTSDTLELPAATAYHFTNDDFTRNFGPSALMAVKITALPKYGTLKKGSVNVTLNAIINRYELDQLVYTPNGSTPGADTIRWNGSNGFAYAAADAMFRMVTIGAPPKPAITGVHTNYCDTPGTWKFKVTNLPAGPGITVQVKLDATALTVNVADSMVSFQVDTLSAGAHIITVRYSSIAGNLDTVVNFTVTATVTPEVNVSANITNVVNLTNPVIITATNAAGGGTTPLYTFAKDKGFTNILQAEGAAAVLNITPSNLTIGDNKIYVRMKTSATCYTVQTNIDSIVIRRDPATSIVDVENPGQLITVFPNPFKGNITVNGLNSGKVYQVVLFNARGQAVYTSEVKNKRQLDIATSGILPGVYWLTLYDSKKKPIGTEKVIKY